jgi:hypothetical protein
MSDKPQQKQRTNRVFKSLHKPLTYLGVERTLFYFVCVGAVGAFNLFNSTLAGIAVQSCSATNRLSKAATGCDEVGLPRLCRLRKLLQRQHPYRFVVDVDTASARGWNG